MSQNPSHGSKQVPPLNREVSLPTYEEATEKVEPAVSAPVVEKPHGEINNVNERPPCNSSSLPVHQTHYQSISPRSTQNMETGLQQSTHINMQYQDPVLREMAVTVTEECRRAKRRRKWKRIATVGTFIFVIFMFIIHQMQKKSEPPHNNRQRIIG